MFGFWENFAINIFLGVLAGLKHNPQAAGPFRTVLTHILNDVCLILGVQPPVVPPSGGLGAPRIIA